MRLLVLGGSAFVGRAVVEEGVARGWDVTTLNRGRGWAHPAATALRGDRLAWPGVAGAWDLVVDTWAQDPAAVAASATALRDHAGRYVYVSSCSVYAPPPRMGADETFPTVAPGTGDHAAVKRGERSLHGHDVERAHAAGLRTRPAQDTVRDTWAWLTGLDDPPPLRPDLPPHGIAPEKERAILQMI